MSNKDELKSFISTIPQEPGVYRYYNEEDTILYVGKAKKLRNRISSYFQDSRNLNYKTKALVKQIHRIEYTLVNTEFDAFLLENSLIKKHTPKYNIQLRDDKSFPYICITDEDFPRLIGTRRFKKIKGTYYGPYSNVKAMNAVMDSIRKLYTIRTCQLSLTKENVTTDKYSVCLEYHINNCLGPCVNKQNYTDYNEKINQAKKVLKGNIKEAKNFFKDKILGFSEQLEFEKAHFYKSKLDLLDKFQNRSIVSSSRDLNLKCMVALADEKYTYIHYIEVIEGSIISSKNYKHKPIYDESIEEVVAHQLIDLITPKDKEVISNIELDLEFPFTYHVPQRGDKKGIVDIAKKNLLQYKKDQTPVVKEQYSVTKELQKQLQLRDEPLHIECFDNSNIQGSNPVASMVCFKKGKPSKKDYRHFNIKTVIGPNDFDSMTEIVGRRYSRLVREDLPLPNLIIIDGGKGQLSAAVKALKELNLYGSIPIIGIAKRLEEIYTPGDSIPLYLDKKSGALKLVQQLRDEAHRFAITFHRTKRSQNSIQTELDNIDGIGEKTQQTLIKHFKSIKRVFEASKEDLIPIVGQSKAEKIIRYKNKKGDSL